MDQAVAEPAKSQHGIMSFRSFLDVQRAFDRDLPFQLEDAIRRLGNGQRQRLTHYGETLRKARIRSMAGFGIFSGRSHRR
jgi:hypothetical protein